MSANTLTAQVSDLTAQVAALTELLTATTTKAQSVTEPRGKTVDLSDPKKVAHGNAAKKVARFFKNGDANGPISYGQRKRLLAIAANGPEWSDFDGLTTAQGAVASYFMERNRPVKFNDLTLTPH